MSAKLARLEKQYAEAVAAAASAKLALAELRKTTERSERIAARKARTRSLIEAGGLCEIAGLLSVDKGTLLGALLDVKNALSVPENAARWKSSGDAELAKRSPKKPTEPERLQHPTPARPGVAQQRVDLVTRYEERDAVKAAGGEWDAGRKVWFVKPGLELGPFAQWLPSP
jgi:hypothetical protein